MKPSLKELGIKFSSDKLYWHSYFNDSMYPKLFEGMQVKKLLEIGIGERGLMQPFLPEGVEYCHGSSLKIWRDYFPEAHIYGADIREDVLFWEDRIDTMKCDQSRLLDLNNLLFWCYSDQLDVVIEDGSHRPEDQMFTASVIVPRLKKGALYVCEDCWPDTGHAIAKELGGEFWQGEKGRDDGLVIIRK